MLTLLLAILSNPEYYPISILLLLFHFHFDIIKMEFYALQKFIIKFHLFVSLALTNKKQTNLKFHHIESGNKKKNVFICFHRVLEARLLTKLL